MKRKFNFLTAIPIIVTILLIVGLVLVLNLGFDRENTLIKILLGALRALIGLSLIFSGVWTISAFQQNATENENNNTQNFMESTDHLMKATSQNAQDTITAARYQMTVNRDNLPTTEESEVKKNED